MLSRDCSVIFYGNINFILFGASEAITLQRLLTSQFSLIACIVNPVKTKMWRVAFENETTCKDLKRVNTTTCLMAACTCVCLTLGSDSDSRLLTMLVFD